jgi:hypothetical protein
MQEQTKSVQGHYLWNRVQFLLGLKGGISMLFVADDNAGRCYNARCCRR